MLVEPQAAERVPKDQHSMAVAEQISEHNLGGSSTEISAKTLHGMAC
jgi:hypothetical protein